MPKEPCAICHKPYEEFGNNAWPVAPGKECCNACNANIVNPARIQLSEPVNGPSDPWPEDVIAILK